MNEIIKNNTPERHFSVVDLDEYIRKGEPSQVERSRAWQTVIEVVQSANSLSLKCNNCTLEELAVFRAIQQNPSVTQK